MSHYTDLVSVRCPISDHLLFQARKDSKGPIVVRCRTCRNYVLFTDVDHVEKIDPPPGSYRSELVGAGVKAF